MLGRLVVALFVLWPTAVLGQVTGRFYIEKDTFALGEPVFLYFEAANSGTDAQNLHKADPYSFCSGYRIHVSSDLANNPSCGGFGGSCASSDAPLEPGKKVTERILLNYEHKIDSAGRYEIEAERNLSYALGSEDFFSTSTRKNSLEVHAHLIFRVDENAEWSGTDLQGWVELLHSTDPAKRREAGRTLASVAPKSLEDVLLGFADNPELRQWAPLAFHRLNTSRSLAGLARILETTEPETNEHMKAADFLAESGDPKWFPRLLDVAQKNSKIGNYVYDAAESGGDQILPTLLSMLQSPDTEFTHPIAVSAFGYTGSRSAVPILLGLLRSSDTGDAERALCGLRQLTHRDVGGDRWFDDPQSQYPRWVNWWNREGETAPIYKAWECGEVKPLR